MPAPASPDKANRREWGNTLYIDIDAIHRCDIIDAIDRCDG